jgi:hypothetical protein
MSGDPGFVSKPVQQWGFANAVPFVANTPASPIGAAVMVNATVAGNIALVTRGGQTVTLAVAVGTTLIPLSCSQMNSSGTTFTGTAYNVY